MLSGGGASLILPKLIFTFSSHFVCIYSFPMFISAWHDGSDDDTDKTRNRYLLADLRSDSDYT